MRYLKRHFRFVETQEYLKPSQVTKDGGMRDNSVRSSKVHFLSWEQEADRSPQSIKRKVKSTMMLPEL